ncbi:MAG: YicC family protein [Bacteroidales bacterium]|nr:YicC family protein [Bacteroidales bacterium]
MKSMTGFAKKQCNANGHKYTIEVKTLNSKAMDTNAKVPSRFHAHELEIRTLLNRLERGKVDFLLVEEDAQADGRQFNANLARQHFQEIRQLAEEQHIDPATLFPSVVTLPDLWVNPEESDLDEKEWTLVRQAIEEAIAEVDRFRQEEGEILRRDIAKHVDLIEEKLHQIPPYEAERIETAKERIRKYFAEAAVKESDPNRFEQELIYYLEKLDITEEKIRLQKHIDYFRQTMAEESANGKKLGFIAQEMGREINTTGSKANHVEIQKLVVEMKDELEKIKEQLGNIL